MTFIKTELRHGFIPKVEIDLSRMMIGQGNPTSRFTGKATLKRKLLVGTMILLLFSSFASVQKAYATGDVQWGLIGSSPASFDITLERVTTTPPPGGDITIQVLDNDKVGNPPSETATARIFSTADPTGVTLTLTEAGANDGTFLSSKIVFMEDNAQFAITSTAIITIIDTCTEGPGVGSNGNCNPAVVETLEGGVDGAMAISEQDNGGVRIHFSETGPNTGIFVGKLQFTTGASFNAPFPQISRLQVAQGSVIAVLDDIDGTAANGVITPLPANRAALIVNAGETATVRTTFEDGSSDSDVVNLTIQGGVGRGGGGLVSPSLVVDAIAPAGIGRGCHGDCTAPTLGVDEHNKRLVSNGFSYNGHPVDVELFYTPYPLITVNVGEKNKAVLKIYDDSGLENIAHVGLAFGLGKGQIFSQSKASIEIDIDGAMKVSTIDPENVLDNIAIKQGVESCSPLITQTCLVLEIEHMFRAPLDFNMVSTMVWDKSRNEWQNYYNHGIEVTGESLNPPKQHTGIHSGHHYTLTETSKNKAVDENGHTWTFDKIWVRDYISQKKIDDQPSSHGYDRNHEHFAEYKKGQEEIARRWLESTILIDIQKAPVSQEIQYGEYISRSEDIELQKRIAFEAKRAELLMQKWYYPHQ